MLATVDYHYHVTKLRGLLAWGRANSPRTITKTKWKRTDFGAQCWPAGLQIVRREFYCEEFSGEIFRRGQLNASQILIEPDAAVMLSLYVAPAMSGFEEVAAMTFCFAVLETKFALVT